MSTTEAKQRIETDRYQRMHRRQPRGYGMWAFEITRADGSSETMMITGTYGEAAGAARALKAARVVVLP